MWHFLPAVPVKIPLVHRDAGKNGISYPKRGPGILGLGMAKALGSEKHFDAQLSDALAFILNIL